MYVARSIALVYDVQFRILKGACTLHVLRRELHLVMSSKVSPYVETVRTYFESNKRKKDYVSHQAKVRNVEATDWDL